jgi:GNAT superfamily N-acetyltransferase
MESPTKEFVMIEIRTTTAQDVPLILQFIRDLAEYEKLSHEVVANEAMLREELFGAKPVAECVIAEHDNEPVGFALYFHNFSTFVGRRGLYLEDLFIKPEMRGKGIGKALLVYLARLAQARNCGRFEWAVLDWNEPSINFYLSLGAKPMNDWTVFRVAGDALDQLAAGES